MPKPRSRERIVDSMLALAAERPWGEVTLSAIAARAEVTLAELRGQFDGRLAILADYIRRVDETVLAGIDPALAAEAPRERLFDVLFARFEAHAPHKRAIANIARAALTDPALALTLNGLIARSMGWMLTAAGIPADGVRGLMRAQGLALVWARVMRVYLDDDDPGLARTMAALDKRLREAERLVMRFDWLDRILERRGGRTPAAAVTSGETDISEGHPT